MVGPVETCLPHMQQQALDSSCIPPAYCYSNACVAKILCKRVALTPQALLTSYYQALYQSCFCLTGVHAWDMFLSAWLNDLRKLQHAPCCFVKHTLTQLHTLSFLKCVAVRLASTQKFEQRCFSSMRHKSCTAMSPVPSADTVNIAVSHFQSPMMSGRGEVCGLHGAGP